MFARITKVALGKLSTSSSRCNAGSLLRSYSQHASKLSVNLHPSKLAKELENKIIIDSQFKPSRSGKQFQVNNPATGELVAHVARGNKDDINDAVLSAKNAQKAWAQVGARQRGQIIAQCGALIKEHSEELAKLVTLETGKAIRTESRVEASVVADLFQFFGGLAPEVKGETLPFNPDSLTMTLREPIGVVGAIIPWNAPLLLLALKIAPAFATGNSVVVKPAEEAPLSVLRLAQIINQVLPPGLLNVVPGYGEDCGEPLVKHRDVGKVSFTGSVETGKRIYASVADKLIPVTLELGGKSPMIVNNDAPVDKVVDGAIVSMRFTRQGQSCTAASRIYVHDDIFEEFVAKMKQKIDALKMGDPQAEETDIGTVITAAQLEKIKEYIKIGEKTPGVRAIHCSQLPTDPKLNKGLFVRPVLLVDVPHDNPVCTNEIFGPVAAIMRWKDFDEVLHRANDTNFGLSASVWTNDLKMALQAVKKLEAGIVQVNQNYVVQPNLPFGGWKDSGLGREGALEDMLEHFTKKKTISINMK